MIGGDMKTILILILMVLASVAQAQRITDEYVTANDIQIRFPGAAVTGEDVWFSPPVISITYSTVALGTHKSKVKLGLQTWEFELQDGMPVLEKAVVGIQSITDFAAGVKFGSFAKSAGTMRISAIGSIQSVMCWLERTELPNSNARPIEKIAVIKKPSNAQPQLVT